MAVLGKSLSREHSPMKRNVGRASRGRLKTPEGRVTRVPNRAKIAEKVRDSCNSSLRTQGFETVSLACPRRNDLVRADA